MSPTKNVLISGASFAGLATAYWMHRAGYRVTIVEIADGLKKGGTPVNIEGHTLEVVRRMGLLEQIRANRIAASTFEFKSAEDIAEPAVSPPEGGGAPADDSWEIERDQLLALLFDRVKDDVELVFGDGLTSLTDAGDAVHVTFRSGLRRSFDLAFGCDGIHSAVRKLHFGHEADFVHFLDAYFSITIVDRLLMPPDRTVMYNEPGKAVLLKTYNGKTDIILCYAADQEIPYDYRDEGQQRGIILQHFADVGWRTPELLAEVQKSKTFYFDKLCQIRMPAWTKGRVALVGDAGYCASPAAGKGGSLALDGAAALADAFRDHPDDVDRAFQAYHTRLRPYIEEVQQQAVEFGVSFLVPRTAEAIRERNARAPGLG